MKFRTICLFCLIGIFNFANLNSGNIDLPPDHLPIFFANSKELSKQCEEDAICPHKAHLNKRVCFGYEDRCQEEASISKYSQPICDEHHRGWVKTKKEQVSTFYKQADFGYVRNVRNTLKVLCHPEYLEDSSLECSENLQFCRARNIWIDFRNLAKRKTPVMYDMDVLEKGEIGGYCRLDKEAFNKSIGMLSSLQSWTPEIQNFIQLQERPLNPKYEMCDQIITTPTFIMKIDATVNMYHHFCDFFNLYVSLHVNSTEKIDPFTKDVRIFIWRTYEYNSAFDATFRAFTSHLPLFNLNSFKGKRVCFKNVVFPLLPRMIFGLYYNTPLIWGCRNSGLFHSFSQFIRHRLRVKERSEPKLKTIRITLLSRDTKFRKILNENDLINALRKNSNYIVNKAKFSWSTSFTDQLQMIQNTDILIGIHGAGLTHLLFLPDWAAVFEIYNCQDENCYKDLARLRGIKYYTWSNVSSLTTEDPPDTEKEHPAAHAKHTNYRFDVKEFVRIVDLAAEHVRSEAERMFGPEKETKHDEL